MESGDLLSLDGNRRLAALIYLRQSYQRTNGISKKWNLLVENRDVPEELFNADSVHTDQFPSGNVESFLGFHHDATGIKQWATRTESTIHCTKLIDERGMSYEEVMRIIGSRRFQSSIHYYISYRLFLQMEDSIRGIFC